jgi:hypothetical protein
LAITFRNWQFTLALEMMRVIARFGDLTASSRSSAAMSFELRFKLHQKK